MCRYLGNVDLYFSLIRMDSLFLLHAVCICIFTKTVSFVDNSIFFFFLIQAREKRKIESEYGGQILEKQRKLNMLKSIVNENEQQQQTTPKVGNFRTPAPKPRTYTTPGKIMSARSESDVSSVGVAPQVTPRTRTATGTISSARSMHGLNRAGAPQTTPRTVKSFMLSSAYSNVLILIY